MPGNRHSTATSYYFSPPLRGMGDLLSLIDEQGKRKTNQKKKQKGQKRTFGGGRTGERQRGNGESITECLDCELHNQ